jgi:fructan beta-fructosidase
MEIPSPLLCPSVSLPKSMKALLSVLILAAAAFNVLAADDLIIADFEKDTYAPWAATGEAFGPGPARGTLPGQMNVSGFNGERLVNSFFKGDDSTGSLTSPEFRIERKFIAFLIGGGKNAEKLALQLLVGGKVVRAPRVRMTGAEGARRSRRSRGRWRSL